MALVYSQNVIEIAVRATISGQPHVNVWHMRQAEGTNVGDGGAAQDFANNWQDHILNFLNNNYVLQDFAWRSLDPDDNNLGVIQPDPVKKTVGVGADDPMPAQVAFLIHKNTANRPRGRRDGRAYIGGVPEGVADGRGTVVAANVTAINGHLLDFWNGVTDDPIASDVDRELVVLETTPESRAPGTLPVIIGSRRVTSLTCDSLLATQRDRLR